MGKSTPTPPPAPDPVAIAGAQGAANTNSAIGSSILNMTGQNTPYGSVSYNQTGSYTLPDGTKVPQFTQNTKLSDNQQEILQRTEGLQKAALSTGGQAINNVGATIGQSFSGKLASLPEVPHSISNPQAQTTFDQPKQQLSLGVGDFSADRQKVEDALMSRFNTDWDNQKEATTAQLNAQGIQAGSEGYGTEMDMLNRARNDAKMQAILGGGQEQSRLFGLTKEAAQFGNDAAAQQFGQNQSAAGFNNAAQGQNFAQELGGAQYQTNLRDQIMREMALERSQPINEFATLFGLGGGVQLPGGAQQTGVGINPADILGANALQYQVLNNNYSQQMQNRNSGLGALGNIAGALGSAAIMGSDRRIKNIHRRIGKTDGGIPLYLFSYKHDPEKVHVGVIAQEAAKTRPDAVLELGGVLHVNYGKL